MVSWSLERARRAAELYPPKWRGRILEALDQGNLVRAVKLMEFADRELDRPPHPVVSDGELTPLQQDVKAGLDQGFTVRKIAEEYQRPLHSVKKAKRALQRKKVIVASCTPRDGTIPTIQAHNFVVEVIVPWHQGTDIDWRKGVRRELVQNYKQNHALKFSGVQEHFELGPQVSVRTTQRKIIITVKDLWPRAFAQDPFGDIKEQGRELAVRAAARLPEIYGLPVLSKCHLQFQGAEWAILEHEVAKLCEKEHIKPVHREDGKKRVLIDNTPRLCAEFTQELDARREFGSMVARSVRGLTNDELAWGLREVAEAVRQVAVQQASLTEVVKAQALILNKLLGVRQAPPAGSSIDDDEGVSYIG